jgi:SAM-dependent methyltransferase
MALALATPHPPAYAPSLACCTGRAHDALRLATATAHVAAPGLVVDIGCGAGGVAVPLLQARTDLRVLGVEIDPSLAAEARHRAQVAGVGRRLSVLVADGLVAPLPTAVISATVNPPLLPGEQGWLLTSGERRQPFAHAIVERLAAVPSLSDIWVHLFDFWGVDVPYADRPTLVQVASANGFEIGYPHRGWRAVGQESAIRAALPDLARLFPATPVRVGSAQLPIADVLSDTPDLLHIRHTIARLHRPASRKGVLL